MNFVWSRVSSIFVAIFSILFQVANAFFGNIIVYEATEGVSFNWYALLHNGLFWSSLAMTILYYAANFCVHERTEKDDERLEEAISNNSIKLLDAATALYTTNDFENGDKVLKALDKIQRRSKK